MNENIENLVLEHLRAIRADIAGIKDDTRDLKQRLSKVEIAIAHLRRDLAGYDETDAIQQLAIDKLSERLERIEHRLGLAE